MAPTDRDVLVALYNATDGPNWKNKTNWDTNADLSDWYGVEADDQGRVVKLSLSANKLRGIFLRVALVCYVLLTFPKNLLIEDDPFMTLLSFWYVPAFCTQPTPSSTQYQYAVRTVLLYS